MPETAQGSLLPLRNLAGVPGFLSSTLEAIYRDIRFAFRQARKNPVFTGAAILSLALGIGANAALFSFVDALLLKRLPVPQPQRLVRLENAGQPTMLSYSQVEALAKDAKQVNAIAGTYLAVASIILNDQPQWVGAELITGDYFRVMELEAARGSLLTPSDLERAPGDPACVISYRFWVHELHASPSVVGSRFRVNTRTYRVLGVLQPGFSGANLQRPTDIYLPVTRLADFMPAFTGIPHFNWKERLFFFPTFARLSPGASRASASTELTRLNRAFLQAQDRLDRSADLQVQDGSTGLDPGAQLGRPAAILLAVASVVLLIACANLATLLLSRTPARSSEFAIRLAIGGSRGRIVLQVFTESAVLGACGSVLGILLAYGMNALLLLFLNRTVPQVQQLQVTPDKFVLAYAAALSILSVLFFGVTPALQASRSASLGASTGNTRPGTALRKAFVVAQVALSVVVVLAAALLTQTLRNLQAVHFGYDPDQVAAIEIKPATGGYDGARADQFYSRVVARLKNTPGVRTASTALGVNLSNSGFQMKLDPHPNAPTVTANIYGVSPGYFETLGGRLLVGRDFNAQDTPDKPGVYIINKQLAERYFGATNPIGRKLSHGQVIGVVSDLHDQGVRNANPYTVYQASTQLLASGMTVLVHSDGSCSPILPQLRTAIRDVDPNTPVFSIYSLQTGIEGALSSEQILGFLSSMFAGLSMLLIATGFYGVLSYMLSKRTREIALRMAIGASRPDIAGLFAKEVLAVIGPGLILGILTALSVAEILQSQLFGVTAHDRQIITVATLIIAVVALLASVPPLVRALRIAPQQALRAE